MSQTTLKIQDGIYRIENETAVPMKDPVLTFLFGKCLL